MNSAESFSKIRCLGNTLKQEKVYTLQDDAIGKANRPQSFQAKIKHMNKIVKLFNYLRGETNHRFTLFSAIFLLLAIIFITTLWISPTKSADQRIEKAWPVAIMPLQFQNLSPEILLYGEVESPRLANLTAAIKAFVQTTPAQEGHHVVAKQLLIQLDPNDIDLLIKQRQAELKETSAEIEAEKFRLDSGKQAVIHNEELLSLAEKAVARQENIFKKQLGSEAALDEARNALRQQTLALTESRFQVNNSRTGIKQLAAKYNKTEALLETAELDKERTQIKAPFAGRISRRFVAPGDRVNIGNSLITLYDDSAIEIRAQIPSRFASKIQQTMHTDKTLSATILQGEHSLVATLDRISGQVRVGRGGVDGLFVPTDKNTMQHLLIGQSVSLLLTLPPVSDVVAIPPSALYGDNRVYVVVDDRLLARPITVVGQKRLENGSYQWLVKSDEFLAEDKIVTTSLPNAITGLKVSITPDLLERSPVEPTNDFNKV